MPPYDDEYVLQRYRALLAADPTLFQSPDDCPIQILLEADQIQEAQRFAGSERAAAGWRSDDLRVGVLADDVYIGHIVRDAVAFPGGRLGLYNRVIATRRRRRSCPSWTTASRSSASFAMLRAGGSWRRRKASVAGR